MRRTDAELIRLHAALRKQAFEAVCAPVAQALAGAEASEKDASVRHALRVHAAKEDDRA